MDSETFWIKIRHSKSPSPLCKKFSSNQKLWEVKHFMQTELQNDVTLWNIQSQHQYGTRELSKTLKDLGISHSNTFMAMRHLVQSQDQVRGKVPFRTRKTNPKNVSKQTLTEVKKSKKDAAKQLSNTKSKALKTVTESKEPSLRQTVKSFESKATVPPETKVTPQPVTCTILIKLADGTSRSGSFQPTSTLEYVVKELAPEIIDENLDLWTSYPRGVVPKEQLKQSLTDLKMIPSASLFIPRPPQPAEIEQSPDIVEEAAECSKTMSAEDPISELDLSPSTIQEKADCQVEPLDLESKFGSLIEPSNGSSTKIQLKLGNGKSLQQEFNENAKLGYAVNFFDKLCDENLGEVTVWISFPRRKLTHLDYESTLSELKMTPSCSLFVAPPIQEQVTPQAEITDTVTPVTGTSKKETGVWTISSFSSKGKVEEGDDETAAEEKEQPHVRMTGVMTFGSLSGPSTSKTSEPVSKTTLIDLTLPDGRVLNHVFNKHARMHYLLSYFSEEAGFDLLGKSLYCSDLEITTTPKDDYANLFDLGLFPAASLSVLQPNDGCEKPAKDASENDDECEGQGTTSVPISTEGAASQDVTTCEPQPVAASQLTEEVTDISNEVTPEQINAMIARIEEIARTSAAMKQQRKQASGGGQASSSGEASTSAESDPIAAGPSNATELTLEEKRLRAKMLIEKENMAKEAKAKEAAKQQEKERRELGQAILDQKRKKEEAEMVKTANTLRQDKLSQKRDMEAIREQIARDKAERRGETYTPPTSEASTPSAPSLPEGKVLINVKFPATDAILCKMFDDEQTLFEVVEYVKNEIQRENFTLWNTFPRKQYKSPDLAKSLSALGLTGNVSLLGMSGKGYSPIIPSEQAMEVQVTNSNAQSTEKTKPLLQTRIQFKKADGSSLLKIFDKDTELVDVIKYFESQCEDLGNSVLWSLYPRYEISHEHINQTLEQLDMCPSAVIFVVSPHQGSNPGKQ